MEVNPWLTYFCAVTRCEHMGFLVSVETQSGCLKNVSRSDLLFCRKQTSVVFDKIIPHLFEAVNDLNSFLPQSLQH